MRISPQNHLISSLAKIKLASPLRIDGIAFVWVDYNAKQSRVGLKIHLFRKLIVTELTYIDQLADISRLEVPEHRRFVEVSHVRDVVELLHLWRIHLHQLVRLEGLFLPANSDIGLQKESESGKPKGSTIYLFSIDVVNHGLIVASFPVRDPDTLLSILK